MNKYSVGKFRNANLLKSDYFEGETENYKTIQKISKYDESDDLNLKLLMQEN